MSARLSSCSGIRRSHCPAYLLIAVSAVCLFTASCRTARMPLPDGLSSSEQWQVEGRQGWKFQESVRFGPFVAQNVDRSWARGEDRQVSIYERNEREQNYSFTLAEGATPSWLVKCRAALSVRTVHTRQVDVELANRSFLDCALTEAEGSTTWVLSLTEGGERPLEGSLAMDGRSYEVAGTTALDGSVPSQVTSGYYIRESERPVAAIEIVNAGSVALDESLEPADRALLSATAAALLLLEELREYLEA